MASDPKTTRRRDMNKLRGRMDGNEGFMSAHQIKKVRTLQREIPAWTLNDKEVQKVILRSFPDFKKNRIHAARAARWVRIIHLYYRMQLPNSHVAKDMGITINVLKMALKGMRRVARGQRTDNIGPLGVRPRGRPKTNN
jgi:hypothetical protein